MFQKSIQGVEGGAWYPSIAMISAILKSLESLIVKDQQNHNIVTIDSDCHEKLHKLKTGSALKFFDDFALSFTQLTHLYFFVASDMFI